MIQFELRDNLVFDGKTKKFNRDIPKDMVYKFLKGKYGTLEKFYTGFCNQGDPERDLTKSSFAKMMFLDEIVEMFDDIIPFTYEEAFKIKNDQFRADVFGTVNITDMIKNLGHKRIQTAGKSVKRKQWDDNGNDMPIKEYDVIYETHKVNGSKLGVEENMYAVKCWCTSTNEEHWLWIEDEYKNDPLEAIASTFRIAENLLPYVKEIKRQGDILIVELTEDVKPEGNTVTLTAEQYFSLLTAES